MTPLLPVLTWSAVAAEHQLRQVLELLRLAALVAERRLDVGERRILGQQAVAAVQRR